jgi:hypothetical protein
MLLAAEQSIKRSAVSGQPWKDSEVIVLSDYVYRSRGRVKEDRNKVKVDKWC